MKKLSNKKSQITCERIKAIRADIKSYKNTILLLDGYADGSMTLAGKNYSEHAGNYKRTSEDNKRYYWTRNYIKTHITLLENELEILIKFGA